MPKRKRAAKVKPTKKSPFKCGVCGGEARILVRNPIGTGLLPRCKKHRRSPLVIPLLTAAPSPKRKRKGAKHGKKS